MLKLFNIFNLISIRPDDVISSIVANRSSNAMGIMHHACRRRPASYLISLSLFAWLMMGWRLAVVTCERSIWNNPSGWIFFIIIPLPSDRLRTPALLFANGDVAATQHHRLKLNHRIYICYHWLYNAPARTSTRYGNW